MNGSLSVRFDSVLGERERADLSTLLGLSGARLASWKPHRGAGRTYARIEYSGASPAPALRDTPGRLDEPALVVLEIEPHDTSALPRIVAALSGPAGPAGVVAALAAGNGVVIELDASRTPLSLVVDVIDVELSLGVPGRQIVPLIGLDDGALAAFAGDVLGDRLDQSRLIETYSEALSGGPRT